METSGKVVQTQLYESGSLSSDCDTIIFPEMNGSPEEEVASS